MKKSYIVNALNSIEKFIQSWIEWENAKIWAELTHPSWLQYATQIRRPELRETYRKKILDGYRNGY